MARRRRRGLGRRVLGGVIFLSVVGCVFWWGWSFIRPPQEEATGSSSTLAGVTPSNNAPLKKVAPAAEKPAPGAKEKPASGAKSVPLVGTQTPPSPGAVTTHAAQSGNSQAAQGAYQAAMRELEKDPVKARQLFSEALVKGLGGADAANARRKLNELGERMIFSPVRTPGDPLVAAYTVKKGETVGKIAAAHHISEDLLIQINQLRNKNLIRENQTIKVVNGPFHAVVDKAAHEMYIVLGDVYVRDYRVALGTNGGTPTGKWLVANHLTNPSWVDPRTGKRWHADDPQNPIGEYWIGLKGIEGEAKEQIGFGIHGTIDEASIGQDVSMGCIRLGAKDVEQVYKLLVPGQSTVVVK